MRRSCSLVGLVLALLVVATASAAEDEDVRLAAFFKKYLDEDFRQRPLTATQLGDHRFDDQLDDVSPKARAAWVERAHRTLRQLPQEIDYQKLTRSGQIDFEIFKQDLTRSLWLQENTRPFEQDPRVYNEYISDSVYLPLVQSTLPKAVVVKNITGRISQIPRILAAAKESLSNPPQVFLDTALRQNRGSISFYERGLLEITGEAAATGELKEAAKKAAAALTEYQKFLEDDLLPGARGDWRIGKEKFARKLELELDAGLTAADVLRDAEMEFARVEGEMYVIARQLWSQHFPRRPLPPDDVEGRRQTIRLVLDDLSKEHGKVEDLVNDARATVARIKTFIAEKDLLRLPEPDRCQVIEMPEFQRGNSVAFLNQAPPLDPQAASVYAVSPPPRDWDARRVTSFLEEYNRYMLPILTIHEGYPGHYVQLEYSNRHRSLIRRVLSSGVFAEGWAVYTEQMMLDQGFGQGDLAMRLHQLKWYLRTVANALLDYRMHCTQMTDAEALAFLTQRVFQSEGEALGKIVRAKQSSCQLSTYFVGRMAFYRLRQEIEREQGDQFDLGRFHEAVLDHGTLPVKYLGEVVRERLKQPR